MDNPSSFQDMKHAGLRLTSIRKQIAKLLSESMYPVSVADLLSTIKANKTTLYREISVLMEYGFLKEFDFGDRIKRYEPADRGHHHHLICVTCKAVSDIELHDDFSEKEKQIALNEGFKVLKHNLEFFGICGKCQ